MKLQGTVRTVVLVAVFAVVLGLMWAQTFAVTGVNAKAATPGADRPEAPEVPELPELPEEKPDLDALPEKAPIWSAIPY